MPDTLPPCPDCGARFTYAVDALLNCPACGHEWSPDAALDAADVIRDAVGNILQDGDTVTVIKDLKVERYRLQDRGLWPDGAEIPIRQKGDGLGSNAIPPPATVIWWQLVPRHPRPRSPLVP
jgi:hypothetical protein